jgi:hypothetical protein
LLLIVSPVEHQLKIGERERSFMAKNIKAYQQPTYEEIAACAHRIYETEGRPEGKSLEHWLQAEAQLVAERKAEAGMLPAKPAAKPMPAGRTTAVAVASKESQAPGWQATAPARQGLHRN